MKERNFKKGEVVCLKGYDPDFGYMVSKGHLEFFDCPEAGLEEPLGIGSFVCEFNSVLNKKPLTMNIRALEDTEGFEISGKDITNFMRNNPGLMLLLNNVKYIL